MTSIHLNLYVMCWICKCACAVSAKYISITQGYRERYLISLTAIRQSVDLLPGFFFCCSLFVIPVVVFYFSAVPLMWNGILVGGSVFNIHRKLEQSFFVCLIYNTNAVECVFRHLLEKKCFFFFFWWKTNTAVCTAYEAIAHKTYFLTFCSLKKRFFFVSRMLSRLIGW